MTSEEAIDHLREALDCDDPDRKDYHVRQALQHLRIGEEWSRHRVGFVSWTPPERDPPVGIHDPQSVDFDLSIESGVELQACGMTIDLMGYGADADVQLLV